MEEENQSNFSSKPFLPLAAGLIGIVLGAAALFFAINTASRASNIEETYKDALGKAASMTTELELLKKKVDMLSAASEDAKMANAKIDDLRNKVQAVFNSFGSQISENRTLIVKNQEAIKELASRGVAAPAPARASSAETPASSDTAPVSTDGMRKHKVKAGENFSVIAKKYGKTVSEIQKANPNVDSSRLNINQEINIP